MTRDAKRRKKMTKRQQREALHGRAVRMKPCTVWAKVENDTGECFALMDDEIREPAQHWYRLARVRVTEVLPAKRKARRSTVRALPRWTTAVRSEAGQAKGRRIDMTDFKVTEKAMRPASDRRECFYCHQPIGSTHLDTCVMLHRRTTVRLTIEYDVDNPACWTKADIESHRNGGGWCANNGFDEIQLAFDGVQSNGCACGHAKYECVSIGEEIRLEEGDYPPATPKGIEPRIHTEDE